MHWSFADVIANISRAETLILGDFLGSGLSARAADLEFNRWLQPADMIALAMDGIIALLNTVLKT